MASTVCRLRFVSSLIDQPFIWPLPLVHPSLFPLFLLFPLLSSHPSSGGCLWCIPFRYSCSSLSALPALPSPIFPLFPLLSSQPSSGRCLVHPSQLFPLFPLLSSHPSSGRCLWCIRLLSSHPSLSSLRTLHMVARDETWYFCCTEQEDETLVLLLHETRRRDLVLLLHETRRRDFDTFAARNEALAA